MSSLWVVHEQVMSEWFLCEHHNSMCHHIAGYVWLATTSTDRWAMNGLPWIFHECFMSGLWVAHERQTLTNLSRGCLNGWLVGWPTLHGHACEAHRLWVVHERFMRGLWVAHEKAKNGKCNATSNLGFLYKLHLSTHMPENMLSCQYFLA